jgi:succinylarginine dihydrolase
MTALEANFDGLVGPTHNYAGLSHGNLASQRNRAAVSRPKEAALQGLAKMKFMADLGLPQGVLPPHPRPDVGALRRMGFTGSDEDVLRSAQRDAPRLLAAACSASAMWSANAATVSPSADCADRRVHFTPANLVSQLHRSLEPAVTSRLLRAIFADEAHFAHHAPLPAADATADEGAANHTRLSAAHGSPGVELFVFGRAALDRAVVGPRELPARQTREACEALARLHLLDPARVVLLQQHPAAIDAGVFHNDVIAVGNGDVLLCHERAYADPDGLRLLAETFERCVGAQLHVVAGREGELSYDDAVKSYLFNSQLVSLPTGGMALIAPAECRENERVQAFVGRVLAEDNPVRVAHYLDVRQSMRNGGGPACLRLRVVLTDAERAAVAPGVWLTAALYERLAAWVQTYYRDELRPDDLCDPALLRESREALDQLTAILGLGAVYDFQG